MTKEKFKSSVDTLIKHIEENSQNISKEDVISKTRKIITEWMSVSPSEFLNRFVSESAYKSDMKSTLYMLNHDLELIEKDNYENTGDNYVSVRLTLALISRTCD